MKPYFQEGGIAIYHGDCREILPQLEPVDHVITDPPYSRDIFMRAAATLNGKDRPNALRGNRLARGDTLVKFAVGSIGNAEEMRPAVCLEIGRLSRRWALVWSDVESTHLWRAALEAQQMRYVRTGAWAKPNSMPQMSGDRPGVGFEACTIMHAKGRTRWNGHGNLALWIHNIASGDDRPDHPCPKPLPLMLELLSLFTDPGETILDPFMGSGTTLRAAKDLGRKAIGIEIEEKYCEIAAKRMSQGVLQFGAR